MRSPPPLGGSPLRLLATIFTASVIIAAPATADGVAASPPRSIATATCANVSAQALTPRVSDGSIVDAAGLCLGVVSQSGFDAVVALPCGASPPRWVWHADGTVELAAAPAGRCLNVNAASTAPGAMLIVWPCAPPASAPNSVFRAASGHIVAVESGLCLAEAAPPPAPGAKGYLDVVADCGADATGAVDATAALRACFVAAYDFATAPWPVPVFFPLGTYTVSDTIELVQVNPGRDDGINVVPARFLSLAAFGSSAGGAVRPTLRLAPNSPGFALPTPQYKPVVHIYCSGGEGVDMNNVWRGVDIDLTAPGNPSAVGISHAGAQGATVSDVAVTASPSTFACFAGLNGAGGEHSNIACSGAQYGVWLDDSQPVPVLVGALLTGQSISAIHYAAQESLSLVGVRIALAAGATGPAIFTRGGNRGMSIIDTSIDCSGAPSATAISTPASLYARDVYVKGCSIAVDQASSAPLPGPADASSWLHVSEWARGTDVGQYFFSNVVYVDGARAVNGSVRVASELPGGAAPPADLVSRHVWDSAAMPGVDSPGIANARTDCGAVGDDATDDTVALQQCVNSHAAVFLPPGRFRISATLELPPGAALVGMGASFSFLLAATQGLRGATPAAPAPLVRTSDADASAAPTVLAFVGVVSWQHLPDVVTLDWRSRNPQSLWRTNFESRDCECLWTSGYQRLAPTDIPCKLPVNITAAKSTFRGLGRVHSFVNDDTGAILSTGASYRSLHIADTAAFASADARLRLYSTNLEHAQSEANGDVVNASWVEFYSVKGEGNMPLLDIAASSSNVNVLALGGGFTAWPMNWTYPPDFVSAVPSTFRVAPGAKAITLAMLQDHGFGQDKYWPPTRGDCHWERHYPYPGAAVSAYPFSTYPNVTMFNCWYGFTVSNAYWRMLTNGDAGTQPGDKPVLWRTSA